MARLHPAAPRESDTPVAGLAQAPAGATPLNHSRSSPSLPVKERRSRPQLATCPSDLGNSRAPTSHGLHPALHPQPQRAQVQEVLSQTHVLLSIVPHWGSLPLRHNLTGSFFSNLPSWGVYCNLWSSWCWDPTLEQLDPGLRHVAIPLPLRYAGELLEVVLGFPRAIKPLNLAPKLGFRSLTLGVCVLEANVL